MLDLLVITGSSKGIGYNILTKCNSICKTLIAIASSDQTYDNIKDCKVIPLKLNLIQYDNVEKKLYNIISKLDKINNIGIVLCGAQLGNYGGLLEADLNNWETTYKCNVFGNLSVIKACSKIIKSGAKTKIAFFAGGGAAFGYPDFSGYSLSKVAIVRAAENLGLELFNSGCDASVIAVAPGAVATDMLAKVIASGADIRTKTDISEPTNFIFKFLNDELPSKELNGKFLHVRDDIKSIDFTTCNKDIFQLRRVQ